MKRQRWLTGRSDENDPLFGGWFLPGSRLTHSAAKDSSAAGFLPVMVISHCWPGHCVHLRLAPYGWASRSQDQVEFLSGLAYAYAGVVSANVAEVSWRCLGCGGSSSARHGRGRSMVTELADIGHGQPDTGHVGTSHRPHLTHGIVQPHGGLMIGRACLHTGSSVAK